MPWYLPEPDLIFHPLSPPDTLIVTTVVTTLLSHQHPSDQNRVGILAPKVKERSRVLKGAGCAETATSPTPAYGVSQRRLACHMEELGATLEVVFAPAR